MILQYLFFSKEKLYLMKKFRYNDNGIELQGVIKEYDDSDNWTVLFRLDGDDDENAKHLSNISKWVESKFNEVNHITLVNDSAAHYNRLLYPLANNFERRLRQFLCLKSQQYKGDKTKAVYTLEEKDFGTIQKLIFVDDKFDKKIKEIVSEKSYSSKEDLVKQINSIDENTLWNTLVSDKNLSVIRDSFSKIKEFRNSIMHAKNITYETYSDAKTLFETINSKLEDAVAKEIEIPVSSEDADLFVSSLNDRIHYMLEPIPTSGIATAVQIAFERVIQDNLSKSLADNATNLILAAGEAMKTKLSDIINDTLNDKSEEIEEEDNKNNE